MTSTEYGKNGNELEYRPALNCFEALEERKARKASLFSIRRLPRDDRELPPWRKKRILYVRLANAAVLFVGGLEISWRRPTLLASLWAAAWDEGFRRGYEGGYCEACKAIAKGKDPARLLARTGARSFGP